MQPAGDTKSNNKQRKSPTIPSTSDLKDQEQMVNISDEKVRSLPLPASKATYGHLSGKQAVSHCPPLAASPVYTDTQ